MEMAARRRRGDIHGCSAMQEFKELGIVAFIPSSASSEMSSIIKEVNFRENGAFLHFIH